MFSYLNFIPCLSTVTFWWQVLAPHSHSARSFTSLLADLSTTVAPNLHQHYFPPSLHRCEHASSPPFSFNPLSTQTRSPPPSRIDGAAISSLTLDHLLYQGSKTAQQLLQAEMMKQKVLQDLGRSDLGEFWRPHPDNTHSEACRKWKLTFDRNLSSSISIWPVKPKRTMARNSSSKLKVFHAEAKIKYSNLMLNILYVLISENVWIAISRAYRALSRVRAIFHMDIHGSLQ